MEGWSGLPASFARLPKLLTLTLGTPNMTMMGSGEHVQAWPRHGSQVWPNSLYAVHNGLQRQQVLERLLLFATGNVPVALCVLWSR